MIMACKMKDKSLQAKLAVSQKVDFEFAQEGDADVLAAMK